jgi:hypothetical protein
VADSFTIVVFGKNAELPKRRIEAIGWRDNARLEDELMAR